MKLTVKFYAHRKNYTLACAPTVASLEYVQRRIAEAGFPGEAPVRNEKGDLVGWISATAWDVDPFTTPFRAAGS